jgi:hypothetical protein
MRAWALLALQATFLATMAAAVPAGEVPQGVWALEKLEIYDQYKEQKMAADPQVYYTQSWDGSAGGITMWMSIKGLEGQGSGTISAWTAPPYVLTPGQKLKMTLVLRAGESRTGPGWGGQRERHMSASFYPPTTPSGIAALPGLVDPKGRNSITVLDPQFGTSSAVLHGEALIPSPWKEQSGELAKLMHFRVERMGVGWLSFRYVYRWYPAGQTPPPPPNIPHAPPPAEAPPTTVPPVPTIPPGPTTVIPGPPSTTRQPPAPTPPTAPPATPTAPPPTPPTAPPAPPSGEPVRTDRLTLQVGSRRVASGDTVTVPVWLINAAKVANMNVAITYQARSAATSGSVAKGNLLDRALFEANPGEPGTVYVGFVLKDGVSGTGTVAQIPFKGTGAPGSRVPLEAKVTSINSADGQRMDIAIVNGMLDIVGQPASPTTPGVTPPPGEPPGVPGDADGDGTLTAGDALLALKMSVRLIPARMTADMDRDGQVTANDARLILVQVVGK